MCAHRYRIGPGSGEEVRGDLARSSAAVRDRTWNAVPEARIEEGRARREHGLETARGLARALLTSEAGVRGFAVASRPLPNESFVPLAQHPHRWMTFAVRTRNGEATLGRMRAVVREMDPELALFAREMMKDRVADSYEEQRFMTILLASFAIAALVLSTMGLFGLVSYTTGQRTRELGIRMALGSTPADVISLVVRGGATLVGIGLALGLVAALAIGRVLAAQIGATSGFDPLVLASIPALLGAAGIVACLVPAWRAVRIPPSVALRYE